MEIKKGIPISDGRGAAPKYPFDDMDLGDCFDATVESEHTQRSITAAAKARGYEVKTSKISETVVRVWLVAKPIQ